MQLSRALAVSLTIALVACTKPDTKPDGVNGNSGQEGNASFRVRSLSGDATVLEVPTLSTDPVSGAISASNWRIPREANFRFTACIQDRATREDALGHQFAVETLEGRRIEDIPATAGSGCFSWFEPIPFNYFVKRSRWTVIERDIVGLGIHTGRQRVRIAINPWAATANPSRDSGDQVRYLRDLPVAPTLLVETAQADSALSGDLLGNDTLFVDDVDVQTVRKDETAKGTLLRFNISMRPKVRFESQSGVPKFMEIPSGDFHIIGHLVLNNAGQDLKQKVILTRGDALLPEYAKRGDIGVLGKGELIDGKLIIRMDAWVEGRMPQGNLELVAKIIPKGVRGLSEFNGIFELGTLRNLSASFKGSLNESCRERGPCDVTSYLKTATNFEEMRQAGFKVDNFPYLFDRIKLRFVQVQPGETTLERTVGYAASICLSEAHTGSRPVELPFTVRYKDTGETHNLETDGNGCLYWSSNVFHHYYHPEEFVERVIEISKGTGVTKEVRFHINPWDDKFTFGFDELEFRPEFWRELKGRKKIPSRFFLASYSYHTVRFQYNIDSLMNLEVRKTVLMELQPRVLRYSGIINARKMTEPTRDGLWLMKIALQKNYLDPSERGILIDTLKQNQAQLRTIGETPEQQALSGENRLRKLGIQAPSKEFVTTRTALIRSTDGVVIQQMELSMQDLRLMRVRSNFLIELQPVDERELKAHDIIRQGYSELLDETMAERQRWRADNSAVDGQKQEELWAAEDERIRRVVADRKALSARLFEDIGSQLFDKGSYEINLAPYSLDAVQLSYVKPLLEKLRVDLDMNDFTTTKLPPCEEIDCNKFVPQNSGLDKRTFVGPVIFLSNAYSDSVRATDNLDEARCGQPVEFTDEFEAELRAEERSLFNKAEEEIAPIRQNAIYRFSEYFGSLRHLCYKHVDDLIAREKESRLLYERNIPAVATSYNIAKAFRYDLVSLTDQKPQQVDFTPENLERCNGDLTRCMQPTEEFFVPVQRIMDGLNRNIGLANNLVRNPLVALFVGHEAPQLKLTEWSKEDLAHALFDKEATPASRRFATCALAVNNLVESFRQKGVHVAFYDQYEGMEQTLIGRCLSEGVDPVFMDRKLRVIKTGQEGDSYVFLGGYQMNINVGQSVSVSRSDSYSRSWGFEATDVLGPFSKALGAAGLIAKPFSVKPISGSQSNSTSEGTSISESTYLVAQIAKFSVRLDEYERCVALKFTPKFIERMTNHLPSNVRVTFRRSPEVLEQQRPLFVCEGHTNNEPTYVNEMYFYFTQHFTEGDMLDQADLYNHPWLLALRGYRDFGAFIDQIHGQETTSFWDALTGKAYEPSNRPIDWPLEHMKNTYQMVAPSFPGFYTELELGEGMTEFPLEKRLQMTDPDVNKEVFSR